MPSISVASAWASMVLPVPGGHEQDALRATGPHLLRVPERDRDLAELGHDILKATDLVKCHLVLLRTHGGAPKGRRLNAKEYWASSGRAHAR